MSASAPHPVGPYSQGIAAHGLFFTAGVGPQNPLTGEVAADVASQTSQVLLNLVAILKEVGTSMEDVVKATVHLQHLERDFAEFNIAYEQFFNKPYPARTTVGSDLLGILVEIDLIVMLPSAIGTVGAFPER